MIRFYGSFYSKIIRPAFHTAVSIYSDLVSKCIFLLFTQFIFFQLQQTQDKRTDMKLLKENVLLNVSVRIAFLEYKRLLNYLHESQ